MSEKHVIHLFLFLTKFPHRFYFENYNMAHMKDYLVKGLVVSKDENKSAIDKISDMVTEWERAAYPDMAHLKMHRSVKHSGDRFKFICHLNLSNVVEADRLCTFKLIAATKDGNKTVVVSKNVCLDHSCRTPEFQNRVGGPTGRIMSKKACALHNTAGDSTYVIAKKRKMEHQLANFKDAWRLINNEKMYAENCFPEKAGYLAEVGIYEAGDLKDLGAEHIETLGALLKDIPRKRWTRLLTQSEKA